MTLNEFKKVVDKHLQVDSCSDYASLNVENVSVGGVYYDFAIDFSFLTEEFDGDLWFSGTDEVVELSQKMYDYLYTEIFERLENNYQLVAFSGTPVW